MDLDYIDLYYCHRFDTTTPLEETLRALSELVTKGKILYYGVSEEWGAARLEESKASQLESNLKAVDVIIPEDALNDIDKILGFVKFERNIG